MGRKLTPEERAEYEARSLAEDKKQAARLGISVEDLEATRWGGYKKAIRQAADEDSIHDPEFEADIERRLAVLGEPYISEFARVRAGYVPGGVLSEQEIARLTLEAMERSAAYRWDI